MIRKNGVNFLQKVNQFTEVSTVLYMRDWLSSCEQLVPIKVTCFEISIFSDIAWQHSLQVYFNELSSNRDFQKTLTRRC